MTLRSLRPVSLRPVSLRPVSLRPVSLRPVSLRAVQTVVAVLAVAGAGRSAAQPVGGPAATSAQVARFLEAAEVKRAAGDDAGALDDLRAANVIVKESRGANHPDVLPILEAAARIFIETGRMREAEKPLLKALDIYDELAAAGRLRHPADLAVCLLFLGKAHAANGRDEAAVAAGEGAGAAGTADPAAGRPLLQSAIRELGRAIEIFSDLPGLDNDVTLASRRELSAAHASLGDVEAATALLRQVLATLGRGGPGNPDLLTTTGALADLLAERGGLADAIMIEADALDAFTAAAPGPATGTETGTETGTGAHVGARIESLRRLGELRLAAEDFTPAEAAFREAGELTAAQPDMTAAGAVLDRVNVLRVQARRGDGDPAELAALVAGLGDRPPAEATLVAAALRSASEAALDLHDSARAADLARRACEIDAAALADHAALAADWTALGRALLGAGDAAAARPALERGLQECMRDAGPAHPRTLRMVVPLAEAAAAAGDVAAAGKLVASVLGEHLPRRGERDEEEICRAVDAVARLLETDGGRPGDRAAAGRLRESLVDVRRRQFGERHPHVAATLLHLASRRQRAGEHAEALPLLEAALTILAAAHGAGHPDVATVLTLLAQSQRAADDPAGAERSLERALAVWEGVVGPGHAVTRETVRSLALVRLALGKRRGALPLMERLLAAYDADPTTDPTDVRRLLIKLAEVRQEFGDIDAARGLVARAQEMDLAGAVADTTLDRVTDIADVARLQQLLGDDFGAAANMSRARTLAAQADDPAAAVARIEASVARRAAPQPVRPAAIDAAAMTAALDRAREASRAGRRADARGIVGAALAGVDRDAAAPAVADLLLAAVEMRPATLQVDAALEDCAQAIGIRSRALGPGHSATLAARLVLATLLYAKGDRAAAAAEIEAVAAAGGAGPPDAADMLRETARRAARVALAAGDRKGVRQLFDCVLAVTPLPDRRLALSMLDTLGDLLDTGRSRSAADMREALLQSGLRSMRADDPVVPRFLVHKGLHAEQAGDLAAAAAAYREALTRDESLHGRSHPLVGADLLALAKALDGLERAPEAVPLVDRARQISLSVDGATAEARDLRTLARAWSRAGYAAEAAEVCKAAIAAEAGGGGRGPGMIEVLIDAAQVQLREGRSSRGVALLREALGIADEVEGPGGMETLSCAIALSRAAADDPTMLASLLGPQTPVGGQDALDGRTRSSAALETPLAANGQSAADGGPPAADVARADAGPMDDGATPSAGMAAQAERARKAFDAALRLYGGDPKKRKKAGAGRQGLESIISYATVVGAMAETPEESLASIGPAEPPPGRESAADRAPSPTPPSAAATPAAAAKPSTPPARPSPFVAASQSGLQQRTALARRRVAGAQPSAKSVEELLRAAWSAHRAGDAAGARAACDDAITRAIREGGETGPRLDEALAQSAAIAVEQGGFVRAVSLLERLGSLRWNTLGPDDRRTAGAATALAGLAAECGDFWRGDRLCRQARASRSGPPDPAATADLEMVAGRVALGAGDVSGAAAAASRSRDLIAAAWTAAAGVPERQARVLRQRLVAARLMIDVGDPVAALSEIDRVVTSIGGGAAHSPQVFEAALTTAARARTMAGDGAGAVATARQAFELAQHTYQPSVATALPLAELALARRAAGDTLWLEPAQEALRILEPAALRMTSDDCDPAALEALGRLAAAALDSGATADAIRAARAAARGAEALPASHPTAGGIRRLAARIAVEQGDGARAASLLADDPGAGADRKADVQVDPDAHSRPGSLLRAGVPPEAEQAFLMAAVGDAAEREAVVRRRAATAGVRASAGGSPRVSRPAAAVPTAPPRP